MSTNSIAVGITVWVLTKSCKIYNLSSGTVTTPIFGSIVATNLRGLDNNIYFQVGLLVLAGLAAKNAILIVEFALQKRREGWKEKMNNYKYKRLIEE